MLSVIMLSVIMLSVLAPLDETIFTVEQLGKSFKEFNIHIQRLGQIR